MHTEANVESGERPKAKGTSVNFTSTGGDLACQASSAPQPLATHTQGSLAKADPMAVHCFRTRCLVRDSYRGFS